ncbi:hypothetical protein [Rhodococcus sp. NPDC058521]|uniref:hypothetical protein n=1 Tax=Rhodococcus sp. NPDC058521 TaxID=3346536 RepID=UPI003646D8B7
MCNGKHSADDIESFHDRLESGEDAIDRSTWAGGISESRAHAPHVRIGREKCFNLLWLLPIGFVLFIVSVTVAKGLNNSPFAKEFMQRHTGDVDTPAPVGLPAWLAWQHFFNLFLMMFMIRAGIADNPRLYWTRNSTPGREWFRVSNPVPEDPMWTAKEDSVGLPRQLGLPGIRHSIGLARWWHLGVDTLWLLTGVISTSCCSPRGNGGESSRRPGRCTFRCCSGS